MIAWGVAWERTGMFMVSPCHQQASGRLADGLADCLRRNPAMRGVRLPLPEEMQPLDSRRLPQMDDSALQMLKVMRAIERFPRF